MSSVAVAYRKHFLPLESNPEVFNELIHLLGASDEIAFEDILSLDEPSLLPQRPTLAAILVLPASSAFEEKKFAADAARVEYNGSGEGEPVVWFKQTIHNACGLYAILHALSNIRPLSRFFEQDSSFLRFLGDCIACQPRERARLLESSVEIERAHAAVAVKGDSAVPESAEDKVDYHYICFTLGADGCLYELDGDLKGPVSLGKVQSGKQGDILGPETISLIRGYIDQGSGNIGYSLMALVHRGNENP
ncbi:putative ubiquitin carboxyl-terminal hydrolase 1 [Triangularia setosa]|uniref:Ubiquitin carboxyl-terminal hydrolase n=1 Tax=Triangularia setosa TaxID=2587417 RepID=A0AAN7A316_9PEZI|nr:putative ubiquitin carboxyl-terminal hydrolase 1 [Podospora setosa]